MRGDCFIRQMIITKSAPLIIWRIIEMLRPIHWLLDAMSRQASQYENDQGIRAMVIPHYEDFFNFLLAAKDDIKRRKRWLEIFGGG